jgi:hypothetical protein
VSLADPQHPLDPRRVIVGHDLRPAQRALLFRRLLLEDVAREGVPPRTLPVPVTLKRFFAPEWVFILGIAR